MVLKLVLAILVAYVFCTMLTVRAHVRLTEMGEEE